MVRRFYQGKVSQRTYSSHSIWVEKMSDAGIRDLDHGGTVQCEENILGFEVAVHETFRVQVLM